MFPTCLARCHIPPNTRHQGNIGIRNTIQSENVSTCSVIPVWCHFYLFLKWNIHLSLSLACTSQVSSHCLSLPSANLFFPPFEDFTGSFPLQCVKIIKEKARASTSLDEIKGAQAAPPSPCHCFRTFAALLGHHGVSSCFQGYLCNHKDKIQLSFFLKIRLLII